LGTGGEDFDGTNNEGELDLDIDEEVFYEEWGCMFQCGPSQYTAEDYCAGIRFTYNFLMEEDDDRVIQILRAREQCWKEDEDMYIEAFEFCTDNNRECSAPIMDKLLVLPP